MVRLGGGGETPRMGRGTVFPETPKVVPRISMEPDEEVKVEEEDQLMGEAEERPPQDEEKDEPPQQQQEDEPEPEVEMEDPLAKVRSSFGLPPRVGLKGGDGDGGSGVSTRRSFCFSANRATNAQPDKT